MRSKRKKLLAIASACAVSSVAGVAHAKKHDEVDGRKVTKVEYELDEVQIAEIKLVGVERHTDNGEALVCSIVGNTKAPPRFETCLNDEDEVFHVELEDESR